MEGYQFYELMGKLEQIRCGMQIRCGIVATQGNGQERVDNSITSLRARFFSKLSDKTGWGRNEVKALFDEAVEKSQL